MAWVKLDDGYFRNPKTRASGTKGRSLHLAGSCWSAANLTNGKIPKSEVPLLVVEAEASKSTVALLVSLNLWHDMGDHYLIHDWEQYIRSKEEVDKERARWRKYKGSSMVDSTNGSTAESMPESNGDSAPSRPDPSRRDLQLPTTYIVSGLEGRAGEVLQRLLATERQTSGPVRSRKAWDGAVTTRLLTEHGERISRLCEDFPTAPPDVIAGCVLGETNNLKYYPRKDTA